MTEPKVLSRVQGELCLNINLVSKCALCHCGIMLLLLMLLLLLQQPVIQKDKTGNLNKIIFFVIFLRHDSSLLSSSSFLCVASDSNCGNRAKGQKRLSHFF